MKTKRPKYYPHWGYYAYSRRGFAQRVRSRLSERGFKPHEIRKLEALYFGGHQYVRHRDDTGTYCNKRCYNLQGLSRSLHYDRKRPIFELVIRSGLFFCYYDEQGELMGFRSPRELLIFT